MSNVPAKWRPTLPMITAGMIALVLLLAVASVAIVRLNVQRPAFTEIAIAAALALGGAAVIGFVFVRTISRPLQALVARAGAIARGDRNAIGPLDHHGTREFAGVTQSFMDMAVSLSNQSAYIRTFARHVSHELKTPLTAIRGAAELVSDTESMAPAERQKFLQNIIQDVDRTSVLLERLSELARADHTDLGGACALSDVATVLCQRFPAFRIEAAGDLDASIAMSRDNALIVFAHLADNAVRHGAQRLVLQVDGADETIDVSVHDDGPGISPGNRDRVFDPFFTTRREQGGTGMGLAIVSALLQAHGGSITLEESDAGARFMVRLRRFAEAAQGLHEKS